MMNKEEQRIAIAEACGWKDCHESENWAATIGTLHEVNGNQYALLADYLNDLNAMHEAEKALLISSFMWETYSEILAAISDCNEYEPIAANAMQRAKALLKTIGKWEGDNQ